MVVRILHEGQWELPGEALAQLKQLDDQLMQLVASADEEGYQRVFSDIVALIRTSGRPLATEELRESDLVVPAADSTLEDVRRLFLEP